MMKIEHFKYKLGADSRCEFLIIPNAPKSVDDNFIVLKAFVFNKYKLTPDYSNLPNYNPTSGKKTLLVAIFINIERGVYVEEGIENELIERIIMSSEDGYDLNKAMKQIQGSEVLARDKQASKAFINYLKKVRSKFLPK